MPPTVGRRWNDAKRITPLIVRAFERLRFTIQPLHLPDVRRKLIARCIPPRMETDRSWQSEDREVRTREVGT